MDDFITRPTTVETDKYYMRCDSATKRWQYNVAANGVTLGTDWTVKTITNMACSSCPDFNAESKKTILPETVTIPSDCANNAALQTGSGCKVTCLTPSTYLMTRTLPKTLYMKCEGGEFKFFHNNIEVPKADVGCFKKAAAAYTLFLDKEVGGAVCSNDNPYPKCYKKGGDCKDKVCVCYDGYRGTSCEFFFNFKTEKLVRYSIAFDIKRGGGKCDPASEENQCNHGTCDKTSETCECSFGYTNLYCETENDDVKILIGSLVGGLAFIGIVVGLYFYCFNSDNAKDRRQNFAQSMRAMGNRMAPPRRPQGAYPPQQQQPQGGQYPPQGSPQGPPQGQYPPGRPQQQGRV